MAAQLGVNTEWRQNCGVGFMLNSALIRQALPDLVAGKALSGKRPGFLGIGGASRPQPSGGTLVTEVVPGSAAQKCGLQVGDAIVEFNGVKISDFEGLCNVTYGLNEGDVVKLKIRRAGQVIDKSATLSGRRD
jgi:putative serine protease PepD